MSRGERDDLTRRYLIPWKPTAWARPRARVFNGRAQFFTSSKARTASEAIRTLLSAQQALLHPRPTPVSLWVNFLVQRPVRAPARVMWPTTRPDIDQYLKLLLDAGNGILWEDDSQVVQINMLKVFAPDGKPRIELSVSVALDMLVTMDPVGVWSTRGGMLDGTASRHSVR
jgi:Holliday junction resolvase RusA-like endonuclease